MTPHVKRGPAEWLNPVGATTMETQMRLFRFVLELDVIGLEVEMTLLWDWPA